MSGPTIYDVAIVGYGPVGQMCALFLGRKGYNVVIYERWPNAYPRPRAVHFDDEIGRIFGLAGVGQQVRDISEGVPDWYEWRAADKVTPLLKINWGAAGLQGWPTHNFFSQPVLEGVLHEAVSTLPNVHVHRGWEAVGQEDHGDHIELKVTDRKTLESVKCRYLLGCDGARSFVRQEMGTPFTDLGFFFDWLILDVMPHEDKVWSPMNWQLCDPKRPTTIVSGGPKRRRWEFMRLPGERIEQLNTEAMAWKLLEPWGRTPQNTTLERHCVYTFQARWAQSWRKGRIFIAGDAAHLMPPFAGQGMCSGLRDAVNLCWKLDMVLSGKADERLLDTYFVERSVHLQNAIHFSIALGSIICVLEPHKAAERDKKFIAADADPRKALPPLPPEVLGPGVVDKDVDGRRNRLRGVAGQLSPQYRIRHGGREGYFDDVVGTGFAVITDGIDPHKVLDREDIDFLKDIGAHLVPLHAPQEVAGKGYASTDDVYIDVDNACIPALRENGNVAMVVRPDAYYYGMASSEADLKRLVKSLRGSVCYTGSVLSPR